MVVSEMGEQWSPNTPPESSAPMTGGRYKPVAVAIGIAMGNIMPHVPKEVPVENAIKLVEIKIMAGSNCGHNNPLVNSAIYTESNKSACPFEK
jgi:hypothetical protein